MNEFQDPDVLVIGAGNAGLIAAISAREAGARVTMLEASASAERGGNSRFASAVFRFAHAGKADLRTIVDSDQGVDWDAVEDSAYSVDMFTADVTGGVDESAVDPMLVRSFVAGSQETVRWLAERGVRWHLIPRPGRGPVIRLPRGGEIGVTGNGVALVETLFDVSERLGVDTRYETQAVDLLLDGRKVIGAMVETGGATHELRARTVVLACGGFEASASRRRHYLGEEWGRAKVRGSCQDDGAMLERALEIGAGPKGDWTAAHAVPIDVNAPEMGDLRIGDATARYSFSFGITVNTRGERFTDEGADEMPFVYSEFGRKILGQPDGLAFQLFDRRAETLLEPRYEGAEPVVADTIGQLADALGISSERLVRTVTDFNRACSDGAFDPGAKDGLAAHPDAQPPKSNWARPLDMPPFSAYPVTCGITFTTGGGLAADENGSVLDATGEPLPGLFAAGEILGGYFRSTVPTGAGLMRGAVLARRAGRAAAAVR